MSEVTKINSSLTNISGATVNPIDVDQCLKLAAQTHPDQLALADSTQSFTWSALEKTLNKVANSLIKSGIKPNQRIAILGKIGRAHV